MYTLLYGVVIVVMVALMARLLSRQDRRRQEAPGLAGTMEYRTDLPIDDCIDRLRARTEEDVFLYTCEREPDGSYLLHFTLHRPTQQPVDTLYALRMEQGRRTVLTLMFLKEAFGYKEPVFQEEVLNEFMQKKLDAQRTL